VRDARGNLTGVFEENAMDLIERPFTAWKNQRSETEKQAAFDRAVELAGRECLAKGITSFQDAGSSFWEIGQFERLAAAGRLPLRLWLMIGQPKAHEFSRLAAFPKTGLGQHRLTVRAVKAYLDGALGSYGAWLLEPYADKPDSYGQNTTPLDSLRALAEQCRQHGLQFCVHAIGDRANREVLDLFGGGNTALRWRIEHAQHVDPADQPRFAELGVIASMQAVHCTSDAPFVVRRLGEERARTGAYAWRSLLDRGARLANGSDAPVEDVDPLPCIFAAVTRQSAAKADGRPANVFFPEQAMTREEALLSYTVWNAFAAFEEGEKGSLTPGKLADVVVLSHDLLRCPAEEIPRAVVIRTYVGGEQVYAR
jgi:predicted amidohydrolase YtcJ